MTRDGVVRILVEFFRDQFSEDAAGVGDWLARGGTDVDGFIRALDATMIAWSADLSAAPRDRQVLMRHPDWTCPAVMHWHTHELWQGWVFSEPILSDIAGSIDDKELVRCEWAPLPE